MIGIYILRIKYDNLDVTFMGERTFHSDHFMVWCHDEGSRVICASLPDVVDRGLAIGPGIGRLRGWTRRRSAYLGPCLEVDHKL